MKPLDPSVLLVACAQSVRNPDGIDTVIDGKTLANGQRLVPTTRHPRLIQVIRGRDGG